MTSIIRKSRKLIGLEVDESKAQHGKIGLTWKILEKYDGATIQLIYASNDDQRIIVKGVIEGQQSINEQKSNLQSIERMHPLRDVFGAKYAVWAGLVVGLMFLMFAFLCLRGFTPSRLLGDKVGPIKPLALVSDIVFNRWLALLIGLMYFGLSIYILLFCKEGILPISF